MVASPTGLGPENDCAGEAIFVIFSVRRNFQIKVSLSWGPFYRGVAKHNEIYAFNCKFAQVSTEYMSSKCKAQVPLSTLSYMRSNAETV
jgi:hypothetical protein